MMNTNDLKSLPEQDILEQLFAETRAEKSPLDGDNFTKIVMNSLPKKRALSQPRSINRQYYFDILGLLIGLVISLLIIQPQNLINKITLPVSRFISISPELILSTSFVMMCLAFTAWWLVERKSII